MRKKSSQRHLNKAILFKHLDQVVNKTIRIKSKKLKIGNQILTKKKNKIRNKLIENIIAIMIIKEDITLWAVKKEEQELREEIRIK